MNLRSALLLASCFVVPAAWAQTPVATADRYAYSANTGWIDLRPDSFDGVGYQATYFSGYAYAANTGWIHFGDGTPVNGGTYANTSATDYGVNRDASGYLSGYAYSANTGWINFGWAVAGNPARPRLDPATGRLTGLAYAANTGWITLGEITAFAVAIPDTTLVAALRAALGKPIGDLTTADLAGLVTFSAPSAGFTSLTGLEHAVNLTHLDISGNAIADLAPLAGLPLLELDASHNRIADLAPLATCPLQVLKLAYNRIANFSPLASHNTLVELDLSHNALIDAQPVATCPNLVLVNLSHNRVKSLLGFNALVHLQDLRADHNRIYNLAGFDAPALLPDLDLFDISANYLNLGSAPGNDTPSTLADFAAKGVAVTSAPQFPNPVSLANTLDLSAVVVPDITVETVGAETLIAGDILFTTSVEIGADGLRRPVVRVFDRTASGWALASSLRPADDVSILDNTFRIAHDGDTLALAGVFRDASGTLSLAAYLFRPLGPGGAWVQETRLAPAPANTVAILDNTVRDAGAVSILDNTVRPGDSPVSILDNTVRLAFDSGRLIFGGLGYDSAFGDSNHRLSPRLFTFVRTTTGAWQERAPLLPNVAFAGLTGVNWQGFSLDLARDQMGLAGILDNTVTPAGQAYLNGMVLAGILDNTVHPIGSPPAAWTAQTLLPASATGVWRDLAVRLHRPGNGAGTLAIAAILDNTVTPAIPSVLLYQNTVGSPLAYTLSHTLAPSDAVDLSSAWTSLSLDFSGPLLAFGGSHSDAAGNVHNSAYLFENLASSWTQRAKIEPPDATIPGDDVALVLDGHALAFATPFTAPAPDQPGGSAYFADLDSLVTTPPVVEFPDAALESLVRTALNLPSGLINRSQLGALTSLDLNGSAVRNLSGLEFAPNLQTLLLANSFVTSLYPVRNLPVYPNLTFGNTWTGGHISGPRSTGVVQNWLPRRPPETFTGFTTLDSFSVTTPGAAVDITHAFAKSFNFNSPGGTLTAASGGAGFTATDGLNVQAGHFAIETYFDFIGPVGTSAGTTIGLNGQTSFTHSLTNRGDFSQRGRIYARKFVNHGSLTLLPSSSAFGTSDSFYGTFDGRPGSSLNINSAVAGPEDILPPSAPGTNNDFLGGFRWSGGGTSTFTIAPRSWSYISLYPATVGDVFSLDSDNRFTFSDATWNVGLNGGFQVFSSAHLPYEGSEPQIALSDLTINNQGILRFVTTADLAFRNLSVTGKPLEIVGPNTGVLTTREITQAPGTEGTLRADIFFGFHKFTQTTLTGDIALNFGRMSSGTSVEIGDLANSTAALGVIGSELYSTHLTAAPGAARTITNTGTLTLGPGYLKIDPTIANSGDIFVAADTSADLARLSIQTGAFEVGHGSVVDVGPVVPDNVTDATPRLPLTLSAGRIVNDGTLHFSLHRIDLHGGVELSGYPITLSGSVLNLAYPAGPGAPLPPASSFYFAAGRNRVLAEPAVPPPPGSAAVPLVPPGSEWFVLAGASVDSSGLLNAGTIYLGGHPLPGFLDASLRTTAEIINTGTVENLLGSGAFHGRLVNQGTLAVTAGSLRFQADPNDSAPPTNRLVNHATITVSPGGTLAARHSTVPLAEAYLEQLGGTLDNQGTVLAEYGARFHFEGGRITGNPVTIVNARLRVTDDVLGGAFRFEQPGNTLDLPGGVLVSGVSLQLAGYGSTPAWLTASAFTNRGRIVFSTTSGEASTLLSVGDGGLTNEGAVVVASLSGGTPVGAILGSLDNRGLFELQAGAQFTYSFADTRFDHRGTLVLGPGSILALEFGGQVFQAHPGSLVRGSGRLIGNGLLLGGQIEPEGKVTAQGDATFNGRLLSRLRLVGGVPVADEFETTGTLDVTGARFVLGATAGATPAVGVRYVVARAGAITGAPGPAYVAPELARRFRAVASVVGNTVGITFHALTPGTQSFAQWAGAYETNGQNATATSDQDQDGAAALLEYAFGLRDDLSNASAIQWGPSAGAASASVSLTSGKPGKSEPVSGLSGSSLALAFPWDDNVRDVTWRIESSTDITGAWMTVTGSSPTISAPDANGLRVITYTLPSLGARSFYRVVVFPGTPPL